MIEISRTLARRFWVMLRKSVLAAEPRGPCPLVMLKTDKQGLTLSCEQGSVGLRYSEPGAPQSDMVALPASLLEKLGGSKNTPVTLEQTAPFKGRARWMEAGGEQVIDFDTADPASTRERCVPAGKTTPLDATFLTALREAALSAAREPARPALTRIQLRGRDGAVIGTDGRQLLVHSGFLLPWKDDILIPSLPVFASRELPTEEQVRLGREGQTVSLELGPWSFLLATESSSRYPEVDRVVPQPGESLTRLALHPDDITVLRGTLPRLPGKDGKHGTITLGLGTRPCIRAQEGRLPPAEVPLTRSKVSGPAVTVAMDRFYLQRALDMGFGELHLGKSDKPVVCRDATRIYLWMPLDTGTSTSSGSRQTAQSRPPDNNPTSRSAAVPTVNGQKPEENHPSAETPDPVCEAEALRTQLQEALSRTSRLIAVLKQQKRRSRVVESAMASLRKLRQLE